MKSGEKFAARKIYTLGFGLFLGLCIWKFGNPVILDEKISTPISPADFLRDPWPTHWANWILLPLVVIGMILAFTKTARGNTRPTGNFSRGIHSEKSKIENRKSEINRWLWLLPLFWFGWQIFSATQTVGSDLTAATLWQLFGCVACYFLGAFVFGNPRAMNFLLVGILAAFTFCLVRAVDQRLIEFPQTRQMLVEGEREHWTNLPPETVLELKQENIIISTNGADVANPVVLAKFAKGRVMGTMVYPNALAGLDLLLLPAALTLVFAAKNLRPAIRALAIALAIFLGVGGLFWSGSKFGWLIAMGIGGLYLLRLNWPAKLKIAAIVAVAIFGLGIFAIRFHHYFDKGATSVVARFDYWRAAIQTTAENPLAGTGPGTFQRPYAKIKSPDAEMARLTHNDYLEQFSDSGIPGGIFYAAWIFLALAVAGKRVWKSENKFSFAIFAGVLGWFIQGFGEFELYIPALAWTAFTLLGAAIFFQGSTESRAAAKLPAK